MMQAVQAAGSIGFDTLLTRKRNHFQSLVTSDVGLLVFAFLASLLLAAPLVAQISRTEQMERALVHVRAQEYGAALSIFRALAAENPHDYEVRNWIARLESWKGNYAQAEQLYAAVLAEQPRNLEAELGLVDVISWQGRHQEALRRLHGMYERDPTNIEVLLRLGKISRRSGERKAALRYYREVLALDPDNQEAREGVALITSETRYQIELGYFYEDFDFATETNGQYAEFLYTDNQRNTVRGRFHYQNKFKENSTRFALGWTHRFFERTYVSGEVILAPTGTVVPNQEYRGEFTQGLHPTFYVGLGYRFMNFRVADVHLLTPLVNWDLHPKLHLFLRYTPARTTFEFPRRSVWNHGGWVRLNWDATRTFSPYFVFAVGSESFTGLSAEQLGQFAAQTYGVGTMIHFNARQGLRLGYFFQNRTQGHREHSLSLAFLLRF